MSENSGWRDKLFGGLKKTSSKLSENLTGLITKGKLDAEMLDEIEEALIVTDLGPATASQIRDKLAATRFDKGIDMADLREVVEEELTQILTPVAKPLEIDAFPRPQVILVIGVNGSGKTTTIAKLAHNFLEQDYGVMLAAGDTFRAAAIGQLKVVSAYRSSPDQKAEMLPAWCSMRLKKQPLRASTSLSSTLRAGCRTSASLWTSWPKSAVFWAA
jgi:fused signal recognition particle receptor